MKVVLFFVALFSSLSLCVYAQGAEDASSGGDIATSTMTTTSMESGSVVGGAPVRAEPKESGAAAVPMSSSSTSTTSETASRSAPSSALTPSNVSPEAVTTIVPTPSGDREVSAPPLLPSTSEEEKGTAPAQVSPRASMVPLAAATLLALATGGVFLLLRTKKQHPQKDNPCGVLKEQYGSLQVAHDAVIRDITLQELLIAELKKEIEDAGNKVKEKIKEYAADVTQEIMEEVIEKEMSEDLNNAVALADEAKAAYVSLTEKYKLATDLLEILNGRREGLADEVREKEAAFNVCMQGAARGGARVSAAAAEFVADGETRVLRGIITESSLCEKSILEELKIRRTWQEGDRILHDVLATEEQALALRNFLHEGPWYAYFREQGNDKGLAVFKDHVFHISRSNKDTWKEVVAYAVSQGISKDQLDFANNDFAT